MHDNQPSGHQVIAWRSPWTRYVLVVTGLIVAAVAVAVITDATHHPTVRAWAYGAAAAFGLVLLLAIGHAAREGDG